LSLQGKLHVDGVLKGSVQSEGDITIGRSGRIEGDIVARRIVISGKLTGSVHCDCIEVVASGVVMGDVVSRELVVEKGAHFEGENRLPEDARETAVGPFLKTVSPVEPALGAAAEAADKAGGKSNPRVQPAQVQR